MGEQPTKIAILGGGFGGLYTALRLHQLDWDRDTPPEITLIDQRDRFVFLPLLYELITDELHTWEIAPPYEELLANTGIQFVQTTVTGIDVAHQTIHLAAAPPLTYDRAVLALGGQTPVGTTPGVKEYALPFHTLEDAYRLRSRLRHFEQSERDVIRIAIVGGGYSGVELACKLADRLGDRGRLRIIERGDHLLKQSPVFNQQAAEQALHDRGIWIDLNTTVAAIAPDHLSLSVGGEVETLPVELVLWTVGCQVSELVRHLPLLHDEAGRLRVLPTLQVMEHPELFALGDIATLAADRDAVPLALPSNGQVAIQQADYCAWNLWATLRDRPLLPFQYQPLGEMLSLGVDEAVLSGLGVQLAGPLAHLLRRFVYLYRLPTLEHQLAVGVNWLTRPILQLFTP